MALIYLKPLQSKIQQLLQINESLTILRLLKGIQRGFKAATYNSLKAEGSLPSPWIVSAVNEFGEIEGIERHDQKGIFGLQFHPESFLSEFGDEIAFNWLQFLKSNKEK
jgi:anthranilate/para-aminobenzoate synthase component II